MALRPTKLPLWASVDEIDPITGNPNKVEPPLQWKNSGVKHRQPVPRQYINYNNDLICDWLEYLDEQVSAPTPIPNILEAVYPVGSIHLSINAANPATYGFPGTWSAISQGRALFGVNTGDSNFNIVKKTGGDKTHSHSGSTGGTAITEAQMPLHEHAQKTYMGGAFERGGGATAAVVLNHSGRNNGTVDDTGNSTLYTDTFTQTTGGGATHNHTISSSSSLPPYYCVYIWERVS